MMTCFSERARTTAIGASELYFHCVLVQEFGNMSHTVINRCAAGRVRRGLNSDLLTSTAHAYSSPLPNQWPRKNRECSFTCLHAARVIFFLCKVRYNIKLSRTLRWVEAKFWKGHFRLLFYRKHNQQHSSDSKHTLVIHKPKTRPSPICVGERIHSN